MMPSLDLISSHRRSASAPVPDSWTLPCASFSTVWASLTESGVPSVSWIPSDSAMTQRPSLSWTDLTSDKNLTSSKMRSGR
jgi:hypothetical protein